MEELGMVHAIRLFAYPPIPSFPFLIFLPSFPISFSTSIYQSILLFSKTIRSSYHSPALTVHSAIHPASQPAVYRLSFPPWCACCLWTPTKGYMHSVYWRVYGWYITELDIYNHTCMAYAGRDCGIHWLGSVYLTGLGESSDKLDSLDAMDRICFIYGGLVYLLFMVMICFICDIVFIICWWWFVLFMLIIWLVGLIGLI